MIDLGIHVDCRSLLLEHGARFGTREQVIMGWDKDGLQPRCRFLAVLYCKQRAQPMIREDMFGIIWQKVKLQGMDETVLEFNVGCRSPGLSAM